MLSLLEGLLRLYMLCSGTVVEDSYVLRVVDTVLGVLRDLFQDDLKKGGISCRNSE